MKIGILGDGNVGKRLSSLFATAGHDVLARGKGGLEAAARHGELVVIALPYGVLDEALPPLVTLLAGKIVVDATNPVAADWSPLLLGETSSAAQEIARRLPGARIVKAFNTIFADVMTEQGMIRDGSKITAFIASDDRAAATTVADFATQMGFEPIVAGPLSVARHLESMAHLNIAIAVGERGGTDAAFVYHRASRG